MSIPASIPNADACVATPLARLCDGLLKPLETSTAALRHPDVPRGRDPQLCLTPADPDTWAEQLRGELTPDQLLETRCFTRDGAGVPQLVEPLRAPGAPLVQLRRAEVGLPFNVVTLNTLPFDVVGEGVAAATQSTLAMMLEDLVTRRGIAKAKGALIAAKDVTEALAWRQLGMAAAPVDDLARCDAEQQRQAVRLLTLVRSPDVDKWELNQPEPFYLAPPRPLPLETVLVVSAWDPRTFANRPASEVNALIELLREVERRARYDLILGRWSPSEGMLSALCAEAVAGRDAEFDCLATKSLVTELWEAGADGSASPPPADSATARQQLARAAELYQPTSASALQAAQQASRDHLEKELLAPLRAAGRASANPVVSTLHHALAESVDLLNELIIEETAEPGRAPLRRENLERRARALGLCTKFAGQILKVTRGRTN